MWKEEENRLKATFKFKNFTEAFAFMNEVAFAAERMDHHPNWENVYNQVSFQLCTHSADNTVTEKDHQLAQSISEIFEKYKTQ